MRQPGKQLMSGEKQENREETKVSPKELLQSAAVAFGMYSRVPVPFFEWTERNMRYSMCFFPLIGFVTGGLLILADLLLGLAGAGAIMRACLLTVIPAWVTGGIHVDGLMDTADALSSHAPVEEKLRILKDPHTGAFAVIVCICYFLLAVGGFSETSTQDLYLLCPCFVLSRAWSGLALVVFRKAKTTGLLKSFSDAAHARRVRNILLGCILCAAAWLVWRHAWRGALAAGLSAVVFLWYRYISYKQFGGITGDLAGFFLQICELVILWGVALT